MESLEDIDRRLKELRALGKTETTARQIMDLLIERARVTGQTDKPLHVQLNQHLRAVKEKS